MSKDLNIHVEQIQSDTALIVVRADFFKFSSAHEAIQVAGQIKQSFQVTGKPVLFMHESMTLEQLSVEQLERLGLERIDRGTS